MTQDDALSLLISFAPSWDVCINQVLCTVNGEVQPISYSLAICSGNIFAPFLGSDLPELVASAKNFIYLIRIEQTLCQPISNQ